jgi:hypothetical protein
MAAMETREPVDGFRQCVPLFKASSGAAAAPPRRRQRVPVENFI